MYAKFVLRHSSRVFRKGIDYMKKNVLCQKIATATPDGVVVFYDTDD